MKGGAGWSVLAPETWAPPGRTDPRRDRLRRCRQFEGPWQALHPGGAAPSSEPKGPK